MEQQGTPGFDQIMEQTRAVVPPAQPPQAPAPAAAPAAGEQVAGQNPPAPALPPQEGGEAATAPRFKTHEAAEDGYRHLQSTHGKVVEKNRRLEAELAAFKAKEAEAAQAAAEAQARDALKTFAAAENRKALDAIAELDPDADDHANRVADIWAECNTAIMTRQGVLPQPATPPAPAGPAPAEAGSDSLVDSNAAIAAALAEAGLPADDPVFFGYAVHAPKTGEDGRQLSFDEQLAATITKTQAYHAEVRTRHRVASTQPMGRAGAYAGVSAPVPAGDGRQPAAIPSMEAILDRVADERTIRG